MFACAPNDVAVARILVGAVLNSTITDAAQPVPSNRTSTPQPCHSSPSRKTAPATRPVPQHDPETSEPTSRQPPQLVLITATDHESRMTTREVLREFSRRQRPPGFRLDLSPRSDAWEHLLATLTDLQPRTILIIAGAEDAARLVRSIRQSQSQSPQPNRLPAPVIFGSPTMGRTRFLEIAETAADGVIFPSLTAIPNIANTNTDTDSFIQTFTAARGHPPDYAAILAYDATRLLIAAVRQAGPNRDRVRRALISLSPYEGIGGKITFDGTGQNTRDNLHLATIRQGRMQLFSAQPN